MLADGKPTEPIEEVIVQKPAAPALSPTPPKLAEHVEPRITTRKRRGMQTPDNGNEDARGSINYPGHPLAPDTRGDGLISAPPQPFIIQAVPQPPQPVVSTLPLYPPAVHHPIDPNITRTPRFPGGYAASTISQSDGGRSSATAVKTIPTPSPASFSFPEAPAIEVYRPGSSEPSEMPRSRVPAEVTRNPHTRNGSGPASAARQDSRPPPRTIYSRRPEYAPAASSATVAAEARRAFRSGPSARNPGDDPSSRPLASTSAIPGPLPSASEPPHKRRGVVGEGEKTRQPTLAQRERKTSASIARSNTVARVPPAPAGASDRKTRAQKAAGGSSSSSSTTSSSANSKNKAVNAGKKRSVEGHVVGSPRIQSATEVESATDVDDKPSPSGSAKKRRRVNDSPVEPGVLPAPQLAPKTAPSVTEASKYKDEDSGYEDDESWSALDELKTPHRNALSLRSRTIFSEDAPSLADPSSVPPIPRPALTIQIPAPPAKGKQTRAVTAAANATTSTGLLNTISDLTEVDALAGFAALSRREVASQGAGSVRLGHGNAAEGPPPIRVSRGNAAVAARGLRLRSAASRVL